YVSGFELLMSSSIRSMTDRYDSSARSLKKPDVSMAVCRPIFLAPANIRLVKASCTMGSPPEMVRPPPSARIAEAKPSRRARTCCAETYVPSLRCHVSGLWQYVQRNRQPDTNSTTRKPGPSYRDDVS